MNLPTLSHLQFAVLESIGTHRVKGRDLRIELGKLGFARTTAAFYQLMSRLEDSGFVAGENEVTPVDGYALKERFYRVTGTGEKAMREAISFYSARESGGLTPGLA